MTNDTKESSITKLAIIGGGASGFFAAISAAEIARKNNHKVIVHLYESHSILLRKVKISGGGRCNVTHNLFEIPKFCENYPRGQKQLKSPFSQFQAKDTVQWFKTRGVDLVAEADGRIFPKSNRSQTIIDCFLKVAAHNQVKIFKNQAISEIVQKSPESLFELKFKSNGKACYHRICLATGSSPIGYQLAKNLGHTITPLAPSLFSFKINHPLLKNMMGTSFQNAIVKLTIGKKKFLQEGPILITHWGLSGPAILKLSAWAAREMKSSKYQGHLMVNWIGQKDILSVLKVLKEQKKNTSIKNSPPQGLSKKYWEKVLLYLKFPQDLSWQEISFKDLMKIEEIVLRTLFSISGKNRFKEEFVECGGVDTKEISLKTMESKITPGLFIVGELMDIDGITGGFNFQNCWTSGYLAGKAMARPF